MKKSIVTIGILIAAFVGLFLILKSNKEKNEKQAAVVDVSGGKVTVREAKAEIKELNLEYTVNGNFVPKQEVFISTELPGRVTQVLVNEGSKVAAGQTLAIIKGDLQEVAVAMAQTAYDDAVNQVERFESAFKSGGVTQQQLDQIKLQMESAKSNLQSAKVNQGNVNVKASFSGIVNMKMVEPGSFVNPGQQLFEIVNINTLKLKVPVDEKTIGNVALGQKVVVKNSVHPDKEWAGTVTFIAPKANASLNFPVELEIENDDDNILRAGMYGTAIFGKDESVEALVVPRTAFVGNISSRKVFVNDNGFAKLREVNIGRDFGEYVEIISGVKEGEKVITSGQINLAEDTAIEVIQ